MRSPLIIAHQKIALVTPATIVWMIPLVSAIVNRASTVVLVCIFKHMGLQMRLRCILDMPPLTLYSIIKPFDALKYHIFENIMGDGAFAQKMDH